MTLSSPGRASRLSRRAVLGAAGGVALTACGARSLGDRNTRRTVRPLSAAAVLRGITVVAHPAFRTSAYGDIEAWMSRLAGLGVRSFRGLYDPANPGCLAAVDACRRYGVGWHMLVVPESLDRPTDRTVADTAAVVQHVVDTCADVCVAIEGLNEPNHNKTRAEVPPDWATAYAAPHQQAIWERVRAEPSLSGVTVIGPALNDVVAFGSYQHEGARGGPDQYHQLAAIGIAAWQDRVALHHYPGGRPPLTGIADRLALLRSAFGADAQVHLTETGYTTAVARGPGGHRPSSEEAAGAYVPRGVLQLAALGVPSTWYELLDDPNPARDLVEANFGLWRVGTLDPRTWTPKPAARGLADLCAALAEPDGPAYRPGEIELEIVSPTGVEVEIVLVGRRDGGVTGFLFRDVEVWDPGALEASLVDEVPVTLDGPWGRRQVEVSGDLTVIEFS